MCCLMWANILSQVTHRFTVNLPRGQKIVVRVSPAMTLADLVMSVCRDKGLDLDLHRYVLQIPGKPGMPVDLNSTVQEAGVYEMNLVTDGRLFVYIFSGFY